MQRKWAVFIVLVVRAQKILFDGLLEVGREVKAQYP
jgi:hypothetical protein